MTTISAPGSKDTDLTETSIDLGLLEEAKVKAKPLGTLRIDASRGRGDAARIDEVKPDTIVELVLEGDLRWITTVERLEADFPERFDRAAAADGSNELRLPTHLGRTALRGGEGDGLKVTGALVFDLDIDIADIVKQFVDDPANKAGEIAGDLAGPAIANWVDKKLVPNPGLYRLKVAENKAELTEQKKPLEPSDLPYLLFLHGTISTTEGSFGGLWEEHLTLWNNIADRYNERVLALEHRTLADSPIANAVALVKQLPPGAKLHLVSHSRGGMIGELLCRSGRNLKSQNDKLFDKQDFELLEKKGYEKLHADLDELNKALMEKSIKVERFVRVACPAAGTTLADGKLDRWLSALMNVVGKIGADASSLYRFVRGFTLAVVKTRTEPETIPGLEAMMPRSPLTAILNRPDITTNADLSVIAGDIEGGGLLQRFGIWLTDFYYQGDHDLVVDTASMYGGQKRLPGQSRRFFDEGPKVYHFRYFKNEKTANKLWDGLARADLVEGEEPPKELAGFTTTRGAPRDIEIRPKRAGEARPSVFILPGILGSELGYGNNLLWLDLKDVFRGRLERLDLHRENPKDMRPFRMFPRYYNELASFLGSSHDVVPFAYDWRISMQVEAKRFALELARQLDGSALPVRILAHSMGGLIARLAFASSPDLWERFKDKEGCRLVMLGTPHQGSFSIPRMLMGKEKTTGMIAAIDLVNLEEDLLKMIRRFPGILELLPVDDHRDFFDERVWAAMKNAEQRGWHTPIDDDLAMARDTWRLLGNAPIDSANMIYVAGKAERTPIDLTIDGSEVRFQATAAGDGRVPWASIPKALPTFYVAAEHGDLPRHEQAFGGYLDLLQQGTTRLLRDAPPLDRGAVIPFDLPDDTVPIYPDDEALEAAVMGGRARYATPKPETGAIAIELRHGDLAFSPFPVMVGHYAQDSLNGTERYLDKRLDQRLSKRHRQGLYPGLTDTAEVVLDDTAFPPGAVVIGLGEVGGLSLGRLKRALLHGLRRYCLTREEERTFGTTGTEADQAQDTAIAGTTSTSDFGLSTLIIGSGDDGMRMEDALAALLDAVLDLKRENELGGLKRIDIVELFEHRAIDAMRELATLRKIPRYEGHLDIRLELKEGQGGIRRLVLEQNQDWSQRIEIKELATVNQRYHGLHFAVLTGRARIEDSVVADTLKLADAFIQAAVEQTTFHGRTSPGRTLFELLFPLRIEIGQQRRSRIWC